MRGGWAGVRVGGGGFQGWLDLRVGVGGDRSRK